MRGSGDAGFTLVELLIAIALLGMLTVLAYGAVQFGNLSWNRIAARRDADADAAAIYRLLGRSIADAYPGFASPTYGDRRIAFDGEDDSLELVAPLPEALSPGIMAMERFALDAKGSQSTLVMTWHLDLPAAAGGALPGHTVQVATSIVRIRFAYFGRQKENEPAAWYDRWAGMNQLPELVRVRLWRAGGPEALWLDFSIEPRTTMNVACVYDPVEPDCQRIE